MNKTARIQASFSLPEVFLEDKIERMGNNQTKMMMPKRRRAVKSSIPGVYAVTTSFMLWFMPVERKSTSKSGIVQVYCSFSGLL